MAEREYVFVHVEHWGGKDGAFWLRELSNRLDPSDVRLPNPSELSWVGDDEFGEADLNMVFAFEPHRVTFDMFVDVVRNLVNGNHARLKEAWVVDDVTAATTGTLGEIWEWEGL